ncbi:hypothetical protein STENO_004093 [Stenotrophomonas maltophilia]
MQAVNRAVIACQRALEQEDGVLAVQVAVHGERVEATGAIGQRQPTAKHLQSANRGIARERPLAAALDRQRLHQIG